jgi:hypothetical protein
VVRSQGAYLMDYADCSLLVARNAVSDEAIWAIRAASGMLLCILSLRETARARARCSRLLSGFRSSVSGNTLSASLRMTSRLTFSARMKTTELENAVPD